MFFAGLDLGQRHDYSAVVVVERIEHRRAFQATAFDKLLVRHVERMPLGTPYPKVVERMHELLHSEELWGHCALAVDATGVGGPVVDMLRAARLGCNVTAVTITGGERGMERSDRASVPKQDLLAEIQVLLETGRLKIGNVRDARVLMRELMDMRTSVNGSGRVRMGAEGTGQHDDLVIALALGCWGAMRKAGTCGERGQRLF